jgi:hypothetical protein
MSLEFYNQIVRRVSTGQQKPCADGRGGWLKRDLAQMLHEVVPGITLGMANKLSKGMICSVLKIAADVHDTSRETIDNRLNPLRKVVEGLRGDNMHFNNVFLTGPTGRNICLPDPKQYNLQPLIKSCGQKTSAIWNIKYKLEYNVVLKASGIPNRRDAHNWITSVLGKESFIHATLTASILMTRRAPCLLGHGLTYICDKRQVNSQLHLKDDAALPWTLLTFMEKGHTNMFSHLENNHHTMADNEYRPILFRLLYTLGVIQRFNGRFKHLDLHTGNVDISNTQTENAEIYKWRNHSRFWVVPANTLMPRMFDFGLSYLPVNNRFTRAFHSNSGVNSDPDTYYDIHTLINNIFNVIHELNGQLPPLTLAFMQRVVPVVLQVSRNNHHGRFWWGKEGPLTPASVAYRSRMQANNYAYQLINTDEYFAAYRNVPDNFKPVGNIWQG